MKKLKKEIIFAVAILFGWIIVGMLVFHGLESWTWIESLYFSVATISTVGYGDIVPTNDASRLFIVFYILIGVSIGIATLSLIGSQIVKKRVHKIIAKEDKILKNLK